MTRTLDPLIKGGARCRRDDGGQKFTVSVDGGAWAGSLLRLDGWPSTLAQTFLSQGYPAAVSLPAVSRDLEALAASLPGMVMAYA
jgi:hypothetical protein